MTVPASSDRAALLSEDQAALLHRLQDVAAPAAPQPASPAIVVVDDDRSLLQLVQRVLRQHGADWTVNLFDNPESAWTFIRSRPVDAVVCDISMPTMNGFELLSRIRATDGVSDIPVVLLTGVTDSGLKHRALDLGATDLLNKPFHVAELLARVRSMLRLKAMQDAARERNQQLEAAVRQRTRELRWSRRQIIWKLAKAAEFRDEETGEHVVRVAQWSARIARELGLPARFVDEISLAAPLHDIGKIAIPDSILLKPDRLTPGERRIMQQHCELGQKILLEPGLAESCSLSLDQDRAEETPDSLVATAAEIAIAHHERWDGLGYPHGLSGDGIPLAARIVAVADVYDALKSARPYKPAFTDEEAMNIILSERGRHFDPQVTDAFLRARSAAMPRPMQEAS